MAARRSATAARARAAAVRMSVEWSSGEKPRWAPKLKRSCEGVRPGEISDRQSGHAECDRARAYVENKLLKIPST